LTNQTKNKSQQESYHLYLPINHLRQGDPMPKMKTHSGAKKRFKTTGTGKLVRRKQGRNHILEKKSSKRKRQLAIEGEISKADLPRINQMLGK